MLLPWVNVKRATMELKTGLQIYVDYESLLGFENISSHQFAAGGRFEF